MTKKNKQFVRKIAYKVREWAEGFAERHGFDDSLGCMCGICSYVLWKQLRKEGIKAVFALGYGHAFVFLEDEYILDVTATQFCSTRRVVLRLLEYVDTEECDYWKIERKLSSESGIRAEMKKGWAEQSPFYSEFSRENYNTLQQKRLSA